MSDRTSVIPLDRQKEALLDRARVETLGKTDGLLFPVHLDLTSALAIIGNLQLALRHPGNVGPSSQLARTFVDGLIGRIRSMGFVATAELARLGDNPDWDSL